VGEQVEAAGGGAERDRVQRVGVDDRADVRPGPVGLQVHDRLQVRPGGQVGVRVVQGEADDVFGAHVAQRPALALDPDGAPVRAADAGVAQGQVLLAVPGEDPAGQRDLPDGVPGGDGRPSRRITHRGALRGHAARWAGSRVRGTRTP
jgi:hypothetical protein